MLIVAQLLQKMPLLMKTPWISTRFTGAWACSILNQTNQFHISVNVPGPVPQPLKKFWALCHDN